MWETVYPQPRLLGSHFHGKKLSLSELSCCLKQADCEQNSKKGEISSARCPCTLLSEAHDPSHKRTQFPSSHSCAKGKYKKSAQWGNSSDHRLGGHDIRTQSHYGLNKQFLLKMAMGNLMKKPLADEAGSYSFPLRSLNDIRNCSKQVGRFC